MKLKKHFWWFLIPVLLIVVIGFTILSKESQSNVSKVTVYKSPTCGCCVNYISLLEKRGYEVEVIETQDMASVKQQYNISSDMESCHTSIFGDYVVEGHVPFNVVAKLLEEKPDIRGIALPDMPAGSPGMPGFKKRSFYYLCFV